MIKERKWRVRERAKNKKGKKKKRQMKEFHDKDEKGKLETEKMINRGRKVERKGD